MKLAANIVEDLILQLIFEDVKQDIFGVLKLEN